MMMIIIVVVILTILIILRLQGAYTCGRARAMRACRHAYMHTCTRTRTHARTHSHIHTFKRATGRGLQLEAGLVRGEEGLVLPARPARLLDERGERRRLEPQVRGRRTPERVGTCPICGIWIAGWGLEPSRPFRGANFSPDAGQSPSCSARDSYNCVDSYYVNWP